MGRARLRPPSDNRAILIEPHLDEACTIIAQNSARLEGWQHDFQGRSSAQLRAMTRAGVLEASRQYITQWDGSGPEERVSSAVSPLRKRGPEGDPGRHPPIFVTGHQPELFHPGVWVKNFVANYLARRCGGQAVHLIVDNDIVKGTVLRVPAGTVEEPVVVQVPLDRRRGERPFEEYRIEDEQTFAALGDRVAELVGRLGMRPLVERIWPDAIAAGGHTRNLGERISAVRRRVERQWGCANLELPISQLCHTEGFYWFACHLLAHLPRFHLEHNRALEAFRRRHRIRSRHHPVPALQHEGDWLEAPFWIWTAQFPHRRQLFVRQEGREVLLTDRDQWTVRLPLSPQREACCAVELMREQAGRGVKIRTRALTTTIFSRLCLAELFIHGLGGARYDELTDEIIRRFYGLEPPQFLTVTGTLHLPLTACLDTPEEARRLARRVRDLHYNPQRYIEIAQGSNTQLAALVENKGELIRMQPSSRMERRDRFERIRQLNQLLAPAVEAARIETAEQLERVRAKLRAVAIHQTRDWAFCVYPEETLHAFYRPFLEDVPVR